MEYILAIFALTVGFLLAWMVLSRRQSNLQNTLEINEKKLTETLNEANTNLRVAEEKLKNKVEELERTLLELAQQQELANNRGMEVATLKTVNENLAEKLENQKSEIENLQKRLTTEFENIATKILKERSDEFSISNHKNLSEILNPLKERILNFEKKVDETYDKELRDKISLREEVRKLTELNTRVSEEANNLTKALKGDVKKQGNWGELRRPSFPVFLHRL